MKIILISEALDEPFEISRGLQPVTLPVMKVIEVECPECCGAGAVPSGNSYAGIQEYIGCGSCFGNKTLTLRQIGWERNGQLWAVPVAHAVPVFVIDDPAC
jgi:hypothetical protein